MKVIYDKSNDVFELRENGKNIFYNDYSNCISTCISNVLSKPKENVKNIDDEFYLKIVPSNACNLSCKYCFSYGDRQTGEILEYEAVQETIKSIVRGGWKNISISFTGGGEPTLNFEFIKKCVESLQSYKNIRYNLTTNGLFDRACLDFLIKAKI